MLEWTELGDRDRADVLRALASHRDPRVRAAGRELALLDDEDHDEAAGEYVKTHWGQAGKRQVAELRTADPRAGEASELGELHSLVYVTTKGTDSKPVEYEHEFARTKPRLAYIGDRLLICGGDYRILRGGITG
jgi:hypothetical protein